MNPEDNKYFPLIKKYFPQDQWLNAYNVMMWESSGNPTIPSIYNSRGTEDSYGLFQINLQAHPQMRDKVLDPEENVKYAAKLYKQSGWRPWYNTAKGLGLLEGNESQYTQNNSRNAMRPDKKRMTLDEFRGQFNKPEEQEQPQRDGFIDAMKKAAKNLFYYEMKTPVPDVEIWKPRFWKEKEQYPMRYGDQTSGNQTSMVVDKFKSRIPTPGRATIG